MPKFRLDFDQPAKVRYNDVWHHFKDDIIEMENYFYNVIPEEERLFFFFNESEFEEAQPDVYDAMVSLAEIAGLSKY